MDRCDRGRAARSNFPVYYEWRFRTGVEGDFEQLVRALVPRDMDPRVGVRDMDISRPGFGVAHVSNPPDDLVSLEGALLAPTTCQARPGARERLRAAGRGGDQRAGRGARRATERGDRRRTIPWSLHRFTAPGTRASIA